jgi:hypothetical protein
VTRVIPTSQTTVEVHELATDRAVGGINEGDLYGEAHILSTLLRSSQTNERIAF